MGTGFKKKVGFNFMKLWAGLIINYCLAVGISALPDIQILPVKHWLRGKSTVLSTSNSCPSVCTFHVPGSPFKAFTDTVLIVRYVEQSRPSPRFFIIKLPLLVLPA